MGGSWGGEGGGGGLDPVGSPSLHRPCPQVSPGVLREARVRQDSWVPWTLFPRIKFLGRGLEPSGKAGSQGARAMTLTLPARPFSNPPSSDGGRGGRWERGRRGAGEAAGPRRPRPALPPQHQLSRQVSQEDKGPPHFPSCRAPSLPGPRRWGREATLLARGRGPALGTERPLGPGHGLV